MGYGGNTDHGDEVDDENGDESSLMMKILILENMSTFRPGTASSGLETQHTLLMVEIGGWSVHHHEHDALIIMMKMMLSSL